MIKQVPLIIVAVVAVMLAVGGWLFINQKRSLTPEQAFKNDTINNVSGTLQDLFARNVPMECTFASADSDTKASGTVKVSQKNVRGDFQSTVNGKLMTSSMIQDGQYVYVWSSDQRQGTKMKVDTVRNVQEQTSQQDSAQQSIDLEKQQVDYSCKPWTPNASAFTPPADVKFTDFSAVIDKSQENVKNAKSAQCAACEQVPAGDAQEQCLKGLGCK